MNKPENKRDDLRDEAQLAVARLVDHYQEWADYYHTLWLEADDECEEYKDKYDALAEKYESLQKEHGDLSARHEALLETTGRRIAEAERQETRQ